MTITTTKLTRAAGLSAVVGGLLFIAVQINHPLLDATFTTTTEYAVRETMKIFMAVFSLIGITGIYLRQVRQIGVLGLIGYVVFGVGYLTILSIQIIGVFVLPTLAGQSARLRQRRPRGGHQRHPDRRHRPAADPHPGRRLRLHRRRHHLRHRPLPGQQSSPGGPQRSFPSAPSPSSPPSVLPELTQRLFAIPVSVALIGLGYSLWREQRTQRPDPVQPGQLTARPDRRQVTIHAAARTTRSTRSGRSGGCRSRWSPSSWSPPSPARCGWSSWPVVRSCCPANPRLTASPVPLVVHIVSALAYAVLGAFQFSAALRRRRPGWHRAAGRVLVVLGLAVAFSALCLTLFYPRQPGHRRTGVRVPARVRVGHGRQHRPRLRRDPSR